MEQEQIQNPQQETPQEQNSQPHITETQTSAPMPETVYNPANYRPTSWFVMSLIATFIFFLPFGLIGIVHAAQVKPLWRCGHYDEAHLYARRARNWTIASILVGIVIFIASACVLYFAFEEFNEDFLSDSADNEEQLNNIIGTIIESVQQHNEANY